MKTTRWFVIATAAVLLVATGSLLTRAAPGRADPAPDYSSGPGSLTTANANPGTPASAFLGPVGDLSTGAWEVIVTGLDLTDVQMDSEAGGWGGYVNVSVQDRGTGSGWESIPIQIHDMAQTTDRSWLFQAFDLASIVPWSLQRSHQTNAEPNDTSDREKQTFDLRIVLQDLGPAAGYRITNWLRQHASDGTNPTDWQLFWDTKQNGPYSTSGHDFTNFHVAIDVVNGPQSGSTHSVSWDNVEVRELTTAVVVDDDGLATPDDCDSDIPTLYDEIQEAVNAALTGDTILVCPGTYNETVKLDSTKAANISVTGADKTNTFITGGIRFEGDYSGLTVENFTITGDGRQRPGLSQATVGDSSSLVTVTNARFADNVFDGENVADRFSLYLDRLSGSFTFERNEVKNYEGWGTLDLNQTYNPVASYAFNDNNIHDNKGSTALRGSSSDRTDTVTATGNVFDNNGGGDSWASLEINEAEAVTVSNNSITNTQAGSWGEGEALQFWHITSLTVTGNTIENNYQGIYFPGDPWSSDLSGVEIHSNSISGNTQFGFKAEAGNTGTADAENNWWGSVNGPTHASNTFNVGSQGDAVSDNVDFVPWLNAAGGASFAPVTTTSPEGSYASVQAGVNASDPGGTVNAKTGIFSEKVTLNKGVVVQAASSPVVDCGGPGNGFTLSANNVTISGFKIRNCSNGIQGQTSNSTISNNVIHDNLNHVGSNGVGISLWGDNDNNQILGNTVYNNDRQGIFIGHCDFAGPSYKCTAGTLISSGNTISGNVIHDNGRYTQPNGPDESQYGIQLWNADGNTVSGNEIYNHSAWWFGQGVYLCQSSNNTVGPGNNLHNNAANVTIWGCDGTSSGNSVSGNTLANPGSSAINVFSNSPATTITGNTISVTPTASASAIDAGDLTGNLTISGNTVSILGGFAGFYHALNVGGAGAGTVTVSNNTLTGKNVLGSNDVGIRVRSSLPATAVVSMTGNTISGFVNGVRADTIAAGAALSAHYNSLSGNSSNGVLNGAAPGAMIDAENNWWGSANGPTHPSNTFNVGSQGVPVSDNVDFVPWLNAAGGASFAPVTTNSPSGSYASIQAGANASNSGGTVNAKAGTFSEQVSVAKANLTLDGAGIGSTIVKPASVVANTTSLYSGAPIATIILVNGVTGVTVKDLTVDGSSAAFNSDSPGYMGIFYRNASGTIDSTHVTNIFHPGARGAQSVIGIFAQSGGGGGATVQVSNSTVDNYGKNGITCNEPGTACTITGNTVTGRGPVGVGDAAQNGIQLGFGATGTVDGNTVSNNSYTGPRWAATDVLVVSANVGITDNGLSNGQLGLYYIEGSGTISGNTVSATTAGVGRPDYWGIAVSDPPGLSPSPFEDEAAPPAGGPMAAPMGAGVMTVVVSGNTLTGDGSASSVGLEADAGYGPEDVSFTASANTISNWGTGVVVAQCTEECSGAAFTLVDVGPDNNISAPIADPSNSGLHAMGTVNLNVHDNTFTGGYDAVRLRLSVTGSVKDNVMSGYAKNGITVGKAADDNAGTNVTVSGNTVTGGGPGQGNAQNGIQVGPNAVARIENNTVSNHVYTLGTDTWDTRTCAGPGTPGDADYYAHCWTAAGIMVYQGTATVTGNVITGNQVGIDDSGAEVHYNEIRDNIIYGENNTSGGTANAENNWWGSCTGPSHSTNPSGTGDAVSDNVDFDPWIHGACDADGDLLTDDAEKLTWFTDWQDRDTDDDGCADGEEALYSEPTLGGQRDPRDPWDFYDVPLPVGAPGTGSKNKSIDLDDTFAVLAKFGSHPSNPPGAPKYDPAYDRSTPTGGYPGPTTWLTEDPAIQGNGVQLDEVFWSLASFGHSCFALP